MSKHSRRLGKIYSFNFPHVGASNVLDSNLSHYLNNNNPKFKNDIQYKNNLEESTKSEISNFYKTDGE